MKQLPINAKNHSLAAVPIYASYPISPLTA